MSSLNRAELIGNLGADPRVDTTPAGVRVASFSIATTEKWTDAGTGEVKERTEWHRVVVWGGRNGDGLAGVVERYARKGDRLFVSGQLRTRKWTDKTGQDRYTTEVVLSGREAKLVLLGAPRGGGAAAAPDPAARGDELDDEIPF